MQHSKFEIIELQNRKSDRTRPLGFQFLYFDDFELRMLHSFNFAILLSGLLVPHYPRQVSLQNDVEPSLLPRLWKGRPPLVPARRVGLRPISVRPTDRKTPIAIQDSHPRSHRIRHISRITAFPKDFHEHAAAEMRLFMDDLNIDRCVLWGHSDGAVTGMRMADLSPSGFRQLSSKQSITTVANPRRAASLKPLR